MEDTKNLQSLNEMPDFKNNLDKVLWLCGKFKIDQLSPDILERVTSFPYFSDMEDKEITPDFVMGASNVILVLTEVVLAIGFPIDVETLFKCYLYKWYSQNRDRYFPVNEFTETEINI